MPASDWAECPGDDARAMALELELIELEDFPFLVENFEKSV